MASYIKNKLESFVDVVDSSLVENITIYKIAVRVGIARWSVTHRYNDFVDLHEKLVSMHGLSKDLLPPKKVIRNKSPKFVEQRRDALNEYLKTAFSLLHKSLPRVLATFLEFHYYDIFFMLQNLSLKFYTEGDKLLQAGSFYKFTPLELYAITERLRMPCPEMELLDKMYHFSHILDFCSQLKGIQVEGSYQAIGTSNIIPNSLHFDLLCFKSLQELTILGVPMNCIQNVGSLRDTLTKLSVHVGNVMSLNEFFLCDILHKELSEVNDTMKWKKLKNVSFGSNNIEKIDWAIMLIPRLQKLTLSSNRMSEMSDLSCLTSLTYLNLSENKFEICDSWHSKIGNIVSIDLSQNKVVTLSGFTKLYSLQCLNLSCNLIADVEEVQHICKLPCLENLWLTANPVASTIDYRVKVIEQFNARMNEICLDNEKASQKEMDTARVLQALRIVKEGKAPSFLTNNNNSSLSFSNVS